MKTILVVDDEPNYLVVLTELLREEGFEVVTADSGITGLQIVKDNEIDLVITDMSMPGMDGITLLKKVKEYNRDIPVIMITAFGEVEKAVTAMRTGAYTYLNKPFNNDELIVCINKAIELSSLLLENRRLRLEIRSRTSFANMIGKNKTMQHIYALIEKIAPTSATVLITGESGTGKELVAKALHYHSPREKNPFISINCAGLPESLLESELFGHEKGSFTGATSLRRGRFELADSGSLFLDEVGEMPMSLQAKLLRVLQERTFERVGGSHSLKVDVRIIAATNKDLKDEVEKGNFREDLYYRLNVLHLHLPPLRERLDDIPLLAAHFLANCQKQLDRPGLEFSPEALKFLTSLPWEGNIRELENIIERAAILCSENMIQPEDVQPDTLETPLPGSWSTSIDLDRLVPPNVSLPELLNFIEEKMVIRALKAADQVQTRAADSLGITKSLLQYKMKKYGLQKK